MNKKLYITPAIQMTEISPKEDILLTSGDPISTFDMSNEEYWT